MPDSTDETPIPGSALRPSRCIRHRCSFALPYLGRGLLPRPAGSKLAVGVAVGIHKLYRLLEEES